MPRRQWLSRATSLLTDKNGDLRKRASDAVEAVYRDVDAHTVVAFAQHSTGAEGVGVPARARGCLAAQQVLLQRCAGVCVRTWCVHAHLLVEESALWGCAQERVHFRCVCVCCLAILHSVALCVCACVLPCHAARRCAVCVCVHVCAQAIEMWP